LPENAGATTAAEPTFVFRPRRRDRLFRRALATSRGSMMADFDIVVIGAGAAGIGAGQVLSGAGVGFVILEARDRVGGRALTIETGEGVPLDLGCGWLHSATRNPFVAVAKELGFTVDRSHAPWARGSCGADLSSEEHAAFAKAQEALDDRLPSIRDEPHDRPVADFFEPDNRWNAMIDAVSTYYSGAEARFVSAVDLDRYDDNGVNWRVREGYGRLIAVHAATLPVRLGCPVSRIDHSGRALRIETESGTLTAKAAIVTLPSNLLANGAIRFSPDLPDKLEAAAALPLGIADKLYLHLDDAGRLAAEGRVFGRTDDTATGAYSIRPMGRPVVECYYGGTLASQLERGGEAAFLDFAAAELKGVFGGDFVRHVSPLPMHLWESDPLAKGSYSFAVPGKADSRAELARPVDGRLFFAGEACSIHDFSTAHGAYETGRDAAATAIAALGVSRS
jgi:monoamine oxidase